MIPWNGGVRVANAIRRLTTKKNPNIYDVGRDVDIQAIERADRFLNGDKSKVGGSRNDGNRGI